VLLIWDIRVRRFGACERAPKGQKVEGNYTGHHKHAFRAAKKLLHIPWMRSSEMTYWYLEVSAHGVAVDL